MKAIKTAIKECLNENAEELKNDLMDLKSTKKLIGENKDFAFDISISYNYNDNALELEYVFKKNEQKISIRFQMSELNFNLNCTNISTNLIEYAIKYFNKKEFKVNIGSFDGDNYVGIKEYINSFYDKDEKSYLVILDYVLEEEI